MMFLVGIVRTYTWLETKKIMTVYLMGSSTETGTELYLESQATFAAASARATVWAAIDSPSPHLLTFLSCPNPVACIIPSTVKDGEREFRWFADAIVQTEIAHLLPHPDNDMDIKVG